MIIALYEDRPWNLVGVKIAVLSLAQHCPGAEVVVHAPDADPAFASWIHRHTAAQLVTARPVQHGWNVKPEILLRHLRENDAAVWFDSDLLCTADWRPLVDEPTVETLVATEEAPQGQNQGGVHRAVAWGFTPTRPLPHTINTSILRVTPAHVELLETWHTLLQDETYLLAQKQPIGERPQHLVGDQEVLTALMSADTFARIPLRLLRQGSEIAHCFGPAGFQPADRLRMALAGRIPPLMHAMGQKPWEVRWSPGDAPLRTRYEQSHARWSPYAQAAATYRDGLEESGEWLDRAASGLGVRSSSLAELPLALLDTTVRRSRARLGIARLQVDGKP